jgi:hypothetical protein
VLDVTKHPGHRSRRPPGGRVAQGGSRLNFEVWPLFWANVASSRDNLADSFVPSGNPMRGIQSTGRTIASSELQDACVRVGLCSELDSSSTEFDNERKPLRNGWKN